MSSGMPDYERIIRPKYGAAMNSTFDKATVGLGKTTLIPITGKGMVYGGLVSVIAGASQKKGVVLLEADGEEQVYLSFMELKELNMTSFGTYPLALIQYDDVNFKYAVGLCRGVTFEESFKVIYYELQGENPFVYSQLMYALL